MAKTLYDKLWDAHVVAQRDDGSALIYIDRQLLHEVTSPQAFEGLKLADRKPWRVPANVATVDHNVPTENQIAGVEAIEDPTSRIQVQTLEANTADAGIVTFSMNDPRQGIVHVMGPEQGRNFAWYDRSVWRLSYLNPRCLRCLGSWYRHQRSRTRIGDTVSGGQENEKHAGSCRWSTGPRRDC